MTDVILQFTSFKATQKSHTKWLAFLSRITRYKTYKLLPQITISLNEDQRTEMKYKLTQAVEKPIVAQLAKKCCTFL
jgi:hypothetical protein